MMRPGVRKLAVTVHIATSLGWFGAVAVFLALAATGLTHSDAQMVRAAYIAMELATRMAIVPLAFGTLATGLIVALGTRWGLLRHYWIVAKLMITVVATAVLLLHTQPIEQMANAAAGSILETADLRRLRLQLIVNSSAALIALLTATALAVYKPRGMTGYGQRRQQRDRLLVIPPRPDRQGVSVAAESRVSDGTLRVGNPGIAAEGGGAPRWVKLSGVVIAALLLLFVLLHATGRGFGLH
jgi:hypothetical protein